METEEYKKMYQLEETHWFFVCKRKFISSFLKKYTPIKNALIFDAGCGTGANHLFLKQFGQVVSLDLSLEAITFCRKRSLTRLIRGDLNGVNFKPSTFHMITSLDVLYHSWVKNDQALLKEFFRILKPGGKLLITDSAFPFLVSNHDKAVMTRERYTISGLKAKLNSAGFHTRRASYMFFTTFPFLTIVRFIQKFSSTEKNVSSNLFPLPYWINWVISKVIGLETALLARISLPFGSSIIILAEKPVK